MFPIVISASILASVASVLGNDYFKYKHNRKLQKTMDKESDKLRKKILKKVKNIDDKYLRNVMINSEIDNYVFKKQYRIKIFTTRKKSQRNLNRILRIHYYIFQKLKLDLLDKDFYEELKHHKRNEIVKYILEIDQKTENTTTDAVRDFIYHHEHLLLNYNEEVQELFGYCNEGHIFIGLQKHKNLSHSKMWLYEQENKVLGLFY